MQLFLIGIGVALGVLLPRIHAGAQTPSGRTVEFLLTIGFGILGLVSIIFSLLFLVVEYSNTALTPRLNLFQGDPWIWRTYGACLGLFTFGFVATLSIGDRTHVSVIVPVVSLVVALVVIGLMRRLQVKAFDSMQLNATLSAISGAGREVIDNVYPAGITVGSPGDAVDVMERGRPVTWDRPGATLEQLDLRKILKFLRGGRSGRIRSCCRERFGRRKCGSPGHGRILRRSHTGCLSYRRRPDIQPGPAPGISTPLRYWPPGPVSSNQ